MPAEEHIGRNRSSKPQMEKRRRARINDSLLQLKNLVLDALNKNNPRHSKLEKADILEMTVRYLRSIHRQQLSESVGQGERAKLSQYRIGYAECMKEVSRYLATTSNNPNSNSSNISKTPDTMTNGTSSRELAELHVRARLLGHLALQYNESYGSEFQGRMPTRVHQSAPGVATVSRGISTRSMQIPMNKAPVVASNMMTVLDVETLKNGHGQFSRIHDPVAERQPKDHAGEASVATADPWAYTSASQRGPMTGGEIRLILPQHLVQSGQIPTHVIPVYATSPPLNLPALPQASAMISKCAPTLSSPTQVMVASVTPDNVHASACLGNAPTSSPGSVAFNPIPAYAPYPCYPRTQMISPSNITTEAFNSMPIPTTGDVAVTSSRQIVESSPPVIPSCPISNASPVVLHPTSSSSATSLSVQGSKSAASKAQTPTVANVTAVATEDELSPPVQQVSSQIPSRNPVAVALHINANVTATSAATTSSQNIWTPPVLPFNTAIPLPHPPPSIIPAHASIPQSMISIAPPPHSKFTLIQSAADSRGTDTPFRKPMPPKSAHHRARTPMVPGAVHVTRQPQTIANPLNPFPGNSSTLPVSHPKLENTTVRPPLSPTPPPHHSSSTQSPSGREPEAANPVQNIQNDDREENNNVADREVTQGPTWRPW